MHTELDYAMLQSIVRLSKSCKIKLIKNQVMTWLKCYFISPKIVDETCFNEVSNWCHEAGKEKQLSI